MVLHRHTVLRPHLVQNHPVHLSSLGSWQCPDQFGISVVYPVRNSARTEFGSGRQGVRIRAFVCERARGDFEGG